MTSFPALSPRTETSARGSKLRILLTDDHAVVRMGLTTLLNAQADMEVAGEATDGREAFAQIKTLQPDVVVMDVSMPGWNGIEATQHIKQRWPEIKVLALSMHEDKSYLRSLLEAGAAGYVLKRSAADELVRAIRAVSAGGMYLDPALSDAVAESLMRGGGAPRQPLRGEISGAPLSEREGVVLRLIAQGFTNKEIGVKLSISVKTVETYKSRSMEKLGLDSRADIVRYALAQGWLQRGGMEDAPPPPPRSEP